MYEVVMYDGGVYRSEELYELIEDVGGVTLLRNKSGQMLTVTMSIPAEDKPIIEAKCLEIGGQMKSVPLAGTEIAVVGPTLGRHHMPHPICDIAEFLRRQGAITVVMGLARGRGKLTAQINAEEEAILNEYDAVILSLGNFKPCVEAKAELLRNVTVPSILVTGPQPGDLDEACDAVVSGVGRKASRMRSSAEIAKLQEVADRVDEALNIKRINLDEDPLFIHPTEVKQLIEDYEPINMCLRPVPMVFHLDGLRVKIPYEEHHEYLENIKVGDKKLGEVCTMAPSKINDSSILIRIKTVSEVKYEETLKNA